MEENWSLIYFLGKGKGEAITVRVPLNATTLEEAIEASEPKKQEVLKEVDPSLFRDPFGGTSPYFMLLPPQPQQQS